MKRTLMILSGCVASILFATNTYAQQTGLVPDQNPRHEEARAKYMAMADSLTRDQGTTIQNTYKAYDWYEAREERRKLRRELRYQNNLYSYPYYDSSYYSPSFGFGWGNHYGNYWGRNRFRYGW